MWSARRGLLPLDRTGGVARRALVHEELVEGRSSAIDKAPGLCSTPTMRAGVPVRLGVEAAFDRRERHTERCGDTVEIAIS